MQDKDGFYIMDKSELGQEVIIKRELSVPIPDKPSEYSQQKHEITAKIVSYRKRKSVSGELMPVLVYISPTSGNILVEEPFEYRMPFAESGWAIKINRVMLTAKSLKRINKFTRPAESTPATTTP